MPKINVYLPDELAETVKEVGVPVSAICQRALEQSVKRISAIRAAVLGDLDEEDPTAGLVSFTQRAKDVLKLGIKAARDRGAEEVGTRDLLLGMLTEGANLALNVLDSLDIDRTHVLRDLRRVPSEESGGTATCMSTTAANALELAVIEALTLGHNYIGCEHLLLGLAGEPDGAAGQVLRNLGAEPRSVRQIVSAVLAGYVRLRANQAASGDAAAKALEQILHRLDKLEEHAGMKQ